MRHLNKVKEFSRVKNQRQALFKTMLGSLIMREKIKTTEAKAKELKRRIDRIVNKAKKSKIENKKVAITRDLRNIIPAEAIKKITGEFLNRFGSRGSGYTRVVKIARRKSDGARMAMIEFV